MRSYSLTFILAGLLALAASFQVPVEIHVVGENVVGGITNAASKAAMAGSSCDYPVYFEIYGFRRWTPRAGNSHSIVVDFGFWDNTTRVATACHLDGSSTDVAAPGLTPRYACEDTKVDFILQSDSLTVVEKVCSYVPKAICVLRLPLGTKD